MPNRLPPKIKNFNFTICNCCIFATNTNNVITPVLKRTQILPKYEEKYIFL